MNDIKQSETSGFRSGYVALVGRPNAGKSTLLNHLSGMHLAIVTPKPQTTRGRITSIVDSPESQIIFVDTPGLHKPDNRLSNYMQETAWRAMLDADVVALLVDTERPGPTYVEKETVRRCQEAGLPVLLLLNKIDKVAKEDLLPVMKRYMEIGEVAEIIPISAKTGDGVELVLSAVKARIPEGPRYFSEDTITDQTERMLAAELVREQVLYFVEQEIPHGVGVRIEAFDEIPEEGEDRERVSIRAIIYCERTAHKKILIGKGGSMLKSIGTAARLRIEEMTRCPVYLELLVIVREDWRNRKGILHDLGYGG